MSTREKEIYEQINFLRGQIRSLCSGNMSYADHDLQHRKVRLIHALERELADLWTQG